MSQSVPYKHYLRALSRWPKDALRPDAQFQDAIRRRVDRKFLPATATANTAAGTGAGSAPVSINATSEMRQINALYSLLENRYKTQYPVSSRIMKPASNPTYYEDLVKEIEAAPTRSIFGQWANKWKGFLRFK